MALDRSHAYKNQLLSCKLKGKERERESSEENTEFVAEEEEWGSRILILKLCLKSKVAWLFKSRAPEEKQY